MKQFHDRLGIAFVTLRDGTFFDLLPNPSANGFQIGHKGTTLVSRLFLLHGLTFYLKVEEVLQQHSSYPHVYTRGILRLALLDKALTNLYWDWN